MVVYSYVPGDPYFEPYWRRPPGVGNTGGKEVAPSQQWSAGVFLLVGGRDDPGFARVNLKQELRSPKPVAFHTLVSTSPGMTR